MTAKEGQRRKDQELIHNLHEKYYAKKQIKTGIAEAVNIKQLKIKQEKKITRANLMEQARAKGIKNFRILNKEELLKVLDPKVAKDTINEVVQEAVKRWKSGWGSQSSQLVTQEA